jgi:hypothetical protein
LNRFSSVRFSVGFASIVNERVFDVLSLFVFLGLCLSQMPNIPDLVIVGSAALGAIAGTIILMVALAYISPNGMKAIAGRVLTTVFRTRFPKLYERLNSLAEGLIDGLRGISSVQTLFAVMGLSLFLWFTMGIFYLIGLPVMGAPAAFWPGMMVNVIVALAVAAPSAPGFVGTFQFGCLIALSTLYDYPKEFSVAYSVVIHVVQAVIIIAVGSTVLFRRGLKLSEVR